MKVLFLTNIPSPYRVDFFHELAKYCDLTVLYEMVSAADRDEAWVRADKENGTYQVVFLNPVLKQSSSAWCPSVKRYLKKGVYDVIIVGGYSTPTGISAICCLNRRKIPYLINCDGGFAPKKENQLKHSIKKYLLSGASGWLSSGKLADQYLIHYGAKEEQIFHYPFTSLWEHEILSNPLSKEEKNRYKQELGIGQGKMILAVGQFIPRKGFDILLQAAAQLETKCVIYIVGGQVNEEYQQLLERYQLNNVFFLSFMLGEQLKKYYYASDIFALPTREDIWGLVINEAMAAGLPVVTTDKCAAGVELLEPENLVLAGDAVTLAERLNMLLKDDKQREQIGARNLEKIREYTIENMAKIHSDIFTQVSKDR